MKLTYPQWLAQGRLTTRFDEITNREETVMMYPGDCYITIQSNGRHHLQIANEEWIEDTLAELAPILYEQWYLREIAND